jgi:hypothetical protein
LNPCTRICSPLPRLSANPPRMGRDPLRADDEARTRDLNLGKVALYQLSYVRLYPDRRRPAMRDDPNGWVGTDQTGRPDMVRTGFQLAIEGTPMMSTETVGAEADPREVREVWPLAGANRPQPSKCSGGSEQGLDHRVDVDRFCAHRHDRLRLVEKLVHVIGPSVRDERPRV